MSRIASYNRPTDSTAISPAIGIRVNQKTGDGVRAQNFKERLRGRSRKEIGTRAMRRIFRADFVERLKYCFLLFSGGGREDRGVREKFLKAFLNAGQSLAIGFLVVNRKGDQCAVNEIDDAGFSPARCAIARDNAGSDGFDFLCFGRREEFPLLILSRSGNFAGVFGGGDYGGPVCGGPGCTECRNAAEQELSSIEFGDQVCA